MVEFGSQIKAIQGDEPGEAVVLDDSGMIPNNLLPGSSGGGDGEWISFYGLEEVPLGALVHHSRALTRTYSASSWTSSISASISTPDQEYEMYFVKVQSMGNIRSYKE